MKSLTSLAFAVIIWIGCILGCHTSQRPAISHSVTYEVVSSDTNGASLTYSNETEGTEQANVNIPWTKRFSVKPGQFLYLSAQNESEYGSITVRINIDGKTVKTATSRGGYAIATSSYRCCE